MSAVPVFADNDGDVWYIPQNEITAWRYWNNHITDTDQEITLDDSSGKIYTYKRSTVVYSYTDTTQLNQIVSNLQAGGCNVTWDTSTNKITGVCPQYVANGSFDISYTTTESNNLSLLHEAPIMKGIITQPSSYSTADRVYLTKDNTFYFAFWINGNISGVNGNMTLYYSDGSTETVTCQNVGIFTGQMIARYEITNTNASKWATISIPYLDGKEYQISPIYYGKAYGITDEIAQMIGYDSQTITAIKQVGSDIEDELVIINNTLTTTNSRLSTINSSISNMNTNIGSKIDSTNSKLDTLHSDMETNNSRLDTIRSYLSNGTSATQSAVSSNSTSNQQFNSSSSQYITAESGAIEDMESGLQDINTSPDLLSSSKFIQSANWVTNQFNRLVTGTPFELVITFALVLGIALVFIGKVK